MTDPKDVAQYAQSAVADLAAQLDAAIQSDAFFRQEVIRLERALDTLRADKIQPGLRPELARFAFAMEEKLRANDHKDGWQDETQATLLGCVCEELGELFRTYGYRSDIQKRDLEYVRRDIVRLEEVVRRLDNPAPSVTTPREAVDVANFCMMIFDLATRKDPA